jgi:hypothetical protein
MVFTLPWAFYPSVGVLDISSGVLLTVGVSICDWGVYNIVGIHPLWAKSIPWAFLSLPVGVLFSAGILYITVRISFYP